MTDVIENEQTEAPAEAPAPAAPKNQPRPCHCQSYEVADPQDDDSVFTTGCEQETKSTFAQGHDARLVSFLVDGHFDGYQIRQVVDGVQRTFPTPADAVADVSNALQTKAEKATANRQARDQAKADAKADREAKKAARAAAKEKEKADKAAAREAEKAARAAEPKGVGAEVVAGSEEGDIAPPADGQVKIKVGRWSYNATIDDAGNAHYTAGSGEEQVKAIGDYQIA